MKKKVKWIMIAIIAVLCVTGALYSASLPVAVEGIIVEPKLAEMYFTEQGIAVAGRSMDVYATVQGKIESLLVTENQSVKAGDVICVIDSSTVAYQILQAESSIKSYQAQLDNLDETEKKEKASLAASRSNLDGQLEALKAQESANSRSEQEQTKLREEQSKLQNYLIELNTAALESAYDSMQKAEILFKNSALSQDEYNKALKAVENAENALAQSKQQLTVIESGQTQDNEEYYKGMKQSLTAQITGIDSAMRESYTGAMKEYYSALIESGQAAVGQLREQLESYTIRAEIDGYISSLAAKGSNVVSTQLPIASIISNGDKAIETYITTNDIDSVKPGQRVDLILKRRSGDKTLVGEIVSIGSDAIIRLSALGVEERRVKVTVTPLDGVDEIGAGFDMDVKFKIYHEENKLTVPKTAIFVVDDKDMVWVAQDGKAHMTEVVKGAELRTEYVIESGISAGDFVVSVPDADGLKEGVRIK